MIANIQKSLTTIRYLLMTSLVIYMSTGCTMLQSRNPVEKLKQDNDPIVERSGGSTPALASLDRRQWVEIRNTTKDANFRLYSFLGAGEWETAETEARNFLLKNPKNFHALTVLATALAMRKNYGLAAYYGELLESYYPGNSNANNLRGLAVLYRTGADSEDYRKAEILFKQSFESDQKQIAAGLNLGQLYLELGKPRAARETYSKVRIRCHDCIDGMIGYGVAQSRIRDFTGAKQTFLGVLSKDSNNQNAMYRLALIEFNGFRNNKGAMNYLERILAVNGRKDNDVQRRAGFMLNKIQVQETKARIELANRMRAKQQQTQAAKKTSPSPMVKANETVN